VDIEKKTTEHGLVVIDVYEHAFYVDYKNNKQLYIDKFMEHINWEEVNRRFKSIR